MCQKNFLFQIFLKHSLLARLEVLNKFVWSLNRKILYFDKKKLFFNKNKFDKVPSQEFQPIKLSKSKTYDTFNHPQQAFWKLHAALFMF